MKELLTYIINELVRHPDEVKLSEVDGERTIVFELRCNREDIGKIIGKNGKTVSAIRTILSTIAASQGRRAILEVVDE
jgi:hypothetical protein